MNEQNFEYLKDNLKYLGFGESLYGQLEQQLKIGAPQFQLQYATQINNQSLTIDLNFRRSEGAHLYFFNSYRATLTQTNGERKDQTFYLSKGKGITAKEAYNLLEGRAVYKELSNKEGQAYKAWLQLDFSKKNQLGNYEVRQFHQSYGFDIGEALSRYAISELKDPHKSEALLHSLRKGNRQAVTIEKEGTISKLFVEASPQYKSVNLYDTQMRRLPKQSLGLYEAAGKEVEKDQTMGMNPNSKAKELSRENEVREVTPQKKTGQSQIVNKNINFSLSEEQKGKAKELKEQQRQTKTPNKGRSL
jgi:hypothetical protein